MENKIGFVCWFCNKRGFGIILDTENNEYYTDTSVIKERKELKSNQKVKFTIKRINSVLCAQNVEVIS